MTRTDNDINLRKEKWRKEISIYHERLTAITKWRPIVDPNLISKFPDIPLSYMPSQKGLATINISLYIMNNIPIILEASRAFSVLWNIGLFSTVTLPVRQIYETWGATHYAYKLLIAMNNSNEISKINAKLNRLLIGARSEVEMPWGGITNEKSINVMDFIRSLNDTYLDAEKTYGFLCESCHPSQIRLLEWSMASPYRSNWDNQVFNKRGHKLLEDTLQAIEIALNGFALDTKRTLEMALPCILAEAPEGTRMVSLSLY